MSRSETLNRENQKYLLVQYLEKHCKSLEETKYRQFSSDQETIDKQVKELKELLENPYREVGPRMADLNAYDVLDAFVDNKMDDALWNRFRVAQRVRKNRITNKKKSVELEKGVYERLKSHSKIQELTLNSTVKSLLDNDMRCQTESVILAIAICELKKVPELYNNLESALHGTAFSISDELRTRIAEYEEIGIEHLINIRSKD